MKEVEETEKKEDGKPGFGLPKDLADREKLREAIEEAKKKLDEAQRDHLQPREMEARLMQIEGKTRFGYNAQAVADEKSGLIVAGDVVSEESDAHQLVRMLDQVREVMGRVAEETLADGGYATGAEVAEAERRGWSVLVNVKKDARGKPFDRSRFRYDPERNVCVCPLNQELTFEYERQDPKAKGVGVYRCRSSGGCPQKWECSSDPKGRKVEVSPHEAVMERQRRKLAEKSEVMKKRRAIIERSFGGIKQNMGFRRWTVKGRDNVNAQWNLLLTAFDLKGLYRRWREGTLVRIEGAWRALPAT